MDVNVAAYEGKGKAESEEPMEEEMAVAKTPASGDAKDTAKGNVGWWWWWWCAWWWEWEEAPDTSATIVLMRRGAAPITITRLRQPEGRRGHGRKGKEAAAAAVGEGDDRWTYQRMRT